MDLQATFISFNPISLLLSTGHFCYASIYEVWIMSDYMTARHCLVVKTDALTLARWDNFTAKQVSPAAIIMTDDM